MASQRIPIHRREALQAVGGMIGLAGVPALSSLTGTESVIRANVGYADREGRSAAVWTGAELIYDFGFDAVTIRVAVQETDRLRSAPGIRYVEVDRHISVIDHGTGDQSIPWGIDRIDADAVHHSGHTGSGAHVAIVDTGIDSTHPDLKPRLGEGTSFVAGVQSPVWQDDNGHGTHVAGIAGAASNDTGVVGVGPELTLHPVKVFPAGGVGLSSDVAAGLEYTADQGWDVANLSLGSRESSELLRDAVAYAYANGVLLVAAAGNEGPCEDCVMYPATYEACIAVSATTDTDGLASFSSTGPDIELAAPGDDIPSTFLGGTYVELDGTSMASPHVAGAGGLLMANGRSHTESRSTLTSTAEDIGLAGTDQGAGLVDVEAAVQS